MNYNPGIFIYLLLFLFCFNFKPTSAASIFDWFWENYESPFQFGKNNQQQNINKQEQKITNLRDGVTLLSVPFEELSPEDKFLQEAERFSGVSLSGIDSCEHRAVMKIQTSCSNINEEELAKLSIGLLNCQLEISGKPQIECTEEMSLKECTAPMDSETWNAYHTINNRARAVCYATRQVQFRALSEMTVNKLMTSALKQLETMDNLEELQKEMSKLTEGTVDSLKAGQQGLLDQNSGLKLATSQVQNHIVANLKQLTQEKTVIQSLQHQLHSLSEKLSEELGHVGVQLETQSEQHQTIQKDIVSKLSEISDKADAIWSSIDERSLKLQKQQEEMRKSSQETMENLKRINASVNYLLAMVTRVRTEVDEKLTQLSTAIGGDSQTLISVTQHILFLLTGVLISLFLQLSLACRFMLLAAVVANITLVYHKQPLNFLHLTGAIAGWWAIAVLVPICWSYMRRPKAGVHQKKEYQKLDLDENDEDNLSTRSSSRAGSVSTRGDFEEGSLRHRRCGRLCRNGQLCRGTPVPGLDTCRRHISVTT
ncbi:protein brambleberry-like [Macrosteles quadrilineatus]|uniref:protein brambleberry-like n=1 Tax=Macrosteles quadrilineatus TaxID=74068 RepID=UPI0023E30F52|nr:protein brambleberry-like [Macrosteles quadrilineatus]